MKAIILAAGMGTRLGKYTRNLPKCMLKFAGMALIERQIVVLRECGINDIIVVKGYMPDKINLEGVKYYTNMHYAETNMVETLMCAEKEMNDDILVCYGDVIYERKIIKKVIKSKAGIGVVADEDYWEYWKARLDNPKKDTESFVVKGGKVVELGNPNPSKDEIKLRYVGIIKFSKWGVKILKEVYHENKKLYFHKNEPWMNSKSFKKAYMTCMLNSIIKSGHEITPIIIKRGWLEFDTNEDYENANQWLKEGNLKRFIDLGA